MNERLFQFIWQFQYYNHRNLITTQGVLLEILYPGRFNTDQGPDFLDARVRCGEAIWYGSIELHLKSSDWKHHRHSDDVHFRNVVLHVVFEDDDPGATPDIPVLELRNRISGLLISRYATLMGSGKFIPCESNLKKPDELIMNSWLDRLAIERVERKSRKVDELLGNTNGHWEEVAWRMLARGFGVRVNADAFETMAGSIPFAILIRHRENIQQLEALLMGQCGLLYQNFKDPYPQALQKEYRHLKKKYRLSNGPPGVFFLRMRPVNFPTIRLSQLAAFIHKNGQFVSRIWEVDAVEEIFAMMHIEASQYWNDHYRFDEAAPPKTKLMGQSIIHSIIINAICPLLFAWGRFHHINSVNEKILHWLEHLRSESNNILRGFSALGIKTETAAGSQGLLEMKSQYCDARRCLECAVGNYLLKT